MRYQMMISAAVLVSGCATGSFCDIYKPYQFDSIDEIDNTSVGILRHIVTHNEVHDGVCK